MKDRMDVAYMPLTELIAHVESLLSNPSAYSEEEIKRTILVICMNKIDFHLAEKLCTFFILSSNINLKYLSILSIGYHIARVYGKLVSHELLNKLVSIYRQKDHELSGCANESLCSLSHYLKIPKSKLIKMAQ